MLRTYGCVANPIFSGRRTVKRLTGNHEVPTLVLDDGTVIDSSAQIIAWAAQTQDQPSEIGTADPNRHA